MISNKESFTFFEREEQYMWFIIMCNMPFFSGKIEWGTSIRGAWWQSAIELRLTTYDEKILMVDSEWIEFVSTMIECAGDEIG